MRIATFNVNDVNRRLPPLTAWLRRERPDVVCLQELKCAQGGFPEAALAAEGYGAAWVGEGRWNGVAILARGAEPVVTRRALPGDPADKQARYLEAAVRGVLVACLYLPNGNPQPGPKFSYKLAWFERLLAHAQALREAGVPAVIAGDFNVTPVIDPPGLDVWPSRSRPPTWADNALTQPEPRAAFARLLAQGWTDALRAHQPEGPLYTFWDYRRQRFERDDGLRLDHLLLSPDLAGRLTAAGVDRWVRAEPESSDHAPAWVELDL